nr:protein rlx [Staphylococcus epidermidis]
KNNVEFEKANDDICVSHHLSIQTDRHKINSPPQAEKGLSLIEKNTWKDELRELIENTKTHTSRDVFRAFRSKGVKVKVRMKQFIQA